MEQIGGEFLLLVPRERGFLLLGRSDKGRTVLPLAIVEDERLVSLGGVDDDGANPSAMHQVLHLDRLCFSWICFLTRRPQDEIDDGVTYGGPGWLSGSFSAPRMRGDNVGGRRMHGCITAL